MKPILRGKVSEDGTTIRVFCPYCDTFHQHGWKKGTKGAKGHRAAHCTTASKSPFLQGGYWIGEAKEFTR